MSDSMPQLKRLAAKNNYTVEDDKATGVIRVWAKEGFAFEGGERISICEGYGAREPEWRQEAIIEAIDRLEFEPPEPI